MCQNRNKKYAFKELSNVKKVNTSGPNARDNTAPPTADVEE